jgi:hypothetical protein
LGKRKTLTNFQSALTVTGSIPPIKKTEGDQYGSYCESYYLPGGVRPYLVAGIPITFASTGCPNCAGFIYYPFNYDHPRGIWSPACQFPAKAHALTDLNKKSPR